mmetsp:Transcript_9243/g.13690  ORF Transcript_9243/g.13690 Transcript_9243/m.13690 type:complete len:199 (+) Transcript_9243:24-620(+)
MTSWRDTLFVWQGPLEVDEGEKKVLWKGTWIGCEECPDAKDVDMPIHFNESEMTFNLTGNIQKRGDAYQIRFMDGTWDLQGDKEKTVECHGDEEHLVYVPSIDRAVLKGRTKPVAAVGANAFGHFVSAGIITAPTKKKSGELVLTLARRYIEGEDVRVKCSARDVYIKIAESDNNEVGWKISDLHAKTRLSKRKRKRK